MSHPNYHIQPETQKNALIALVITALLTAIPSLWLHGYGSEGDAFTHYFISLQAWKNPLLLLDLWGRPLFTLTTMPFALAGFFGLKLYALVLALLAGWFAYLITRKMAFSEAWVSIPLVVFTPIYYYLVFNPLTETLMAFMLVLSFYFFTEKKYDAAAVVAGLIPFARLEAFVLFPVFIIAFLLRKKIRPVLLLFSGYLFFGMIGYLVFGEFFWFIEKNPYTSGATGIYGRGELLHFIKHTPQILGYPLTFLAIIGLLAWGWNLLKEKKPWTKLAEDVSLWLLIAGSYFAYLAAHSYSWWSGKGNSLGLLRVMAAVTPAAALMATAGIHYVGAQFSKIKIKERYIALTLVLWITAISLGKHFFYKPSKEEVEVARATQWMKDKNLLDKKIYYFHPLMGIMTGRGGFEDERGAMKVHFAGFKADEVTPGALVAWDAHFGPNEGQTSLESLLGNPAFRLLTEIKPDEPFKTLRDQDFKICIFERLEDYKIRGVADSTLGMLVIRQEGFEKQGTEYNPHLDSTNAHSGKYSYIVKDNQEFYEFFSSDLQTLDLAGSDSSLRIKVWVKPENNNNTEVFLVSDLSLPGSKRYKSVPITSSQINNKGWVLLENTVDLRGARSGSKVKVYLWNRGKQRLRMDDAILGYGMKPLYINNRPRESSQAENSFSGRILRRNGRGIKEF
ncbi:MAG: hypothetical protein ACP5O2_01375 [Bacteroidales bacterium]